MQTIRMTSVICRRWTMSGILNHRLLRKCRVSGYTSTRPCFHTSSICLTTIDETTCQIPDDEFGNDFYGLRGDLNMSYMRDGKNINEHLCYVNVGEFKYENELTNIDPQSFVPVEIPKAERAPVTFTAYGVVRYDRKQTTEKESEKNKREKKKIKKSKIQQPTLMTTLTDVERGDNSNVTPNISHTSDYTNTDYKYKDRIVAGKDSITTAKESKPNSEVFKTCHSDKPSDLGFIDEQFFQYDSQAASSVSKSPYPILNTTTDESSTITEKKHPDLVKHQRSNESLDLGYIDKHYFQYDSHRNKSVQEKYVIPETNNSNDQVDGSQLSYIDHQYFHHEKQNTDMLEPSLEKEHVKTYNEPQSIVQTNNDNDSFEIQSSNTIRPDREVFSNPKVQLLFKKPQNENQGKSFMDQLFLDPTDKQSLVASYKSVVANNEKTDFRDKMFDTAKDLKQLKQLTVRQKVLKERESLYEGKAYNVVKEIREKETASKGENKFYTLDSHGYRVYKNQVPPLQFASSVDIVHLLRKNILYNQNDILAIDKPYGLASHGGPGIKHSIGQLMDDILPSTKLHLIHRLDKETTGVILLAKTPEMANTLKTVFKKREVKKRYLTITKGFPSAPKGLIDIPIAEGKVDDQYRMTLRPYKSPEINPLIKSSQKGDDAKTLYRVLDSQNKTTLIECIAITGLKHQIRVHLAQGLNCPVLGDHKYSHLNKIAPMQLHPITLERLKIRQSKVRYVPMHLHARSVLIPDLVDGKHFFIVAPLPPFFVMNLRSLNMKLPPNC